MRSQIVTVTIVLLILLGSILAPPALAQDPDRGTTLVCVHAPGGSLAVEEWTPEQVADYQAQDRGDVAEVPVHLVTGDSGAPGAF